MALPVEEARDVAEKIFTLGDFQNLLNAMRERGWTLGSVEYVVDQVFFAEKDERTRVQKRQWW